MTLLLVVVCFLLMFLWLDLRINDLQKTGKDIQYSIPKLLDKITHLRKRLEETEKQLNIEKTAPDKIDQ